VGQLANESHEVRDQNESTGGEKEFSGCRAKAKFEVCSKTPRASLREEVS